MYLVFFDVNLSQQLSIMTNKKNRLGHTVGHFAPTLFYVSAINNLSFSVMFFSEKNNKIS